MKILRQHIDEYGTGEDGRVFRSERGGVIGSTAYTEVWQDARKPALCPDGLSSRAQAVRPAARGGVALAQRRCLGSRCGRAGHSVDVLLRVYAKCLDGHKDVANKRIDDAPAA
ncbi:hypothetical protein [Streptosporangium roseum]|uniref:hypothetical protein n=1 Tax=Streptosporangium roseum TaxID=2001 RepID=UPI0033277074